MPLLLKIRVPSGVLGSQLSEAVLRPVRAGIQEAMAAAAPFLVDRIGSEADKVLHTTAPIYKRGLAQPESVQVGADYAVVQLVGDLPEALERGWATFDMKSKMLAQAHKFGKDGKPYVDVPFQFSVQKSATHMQAMPPEIAAP